MADLKTTQLSELTIPDGNDLLKSVDISVGGSRKLKLSVLESFFLTATKIKTALGISTLSGSNTGDQTTISGNAGSATILQTARLINGVSFNGSADVQVSANLNGWIPSTLAWSYVSVDNPTGVIKVNADVTTIYSAGMRIKMTNGGNTIFGIITKVGTYGGDLAGYTYLTFLHEINPSTNQALYLMANSAITNNYYSTQKIPFGFPISKDKWTVKFVSSADVITNSPTINTWYNINSLVIPIGYWDISWSGVLAVTSTATQTAIRISGTLSTSNNSESDVEMSAYTGITTPSGSLVYPAFMSILPKTIALTSKTTYYINYRTISASASIASLSTPYTNAPIIIKAICSYL